MKWIIVTDTDDQPIGFDVDSISVVETTSPDTIRVYCTHEWFLVKDTVDGFVRKMNVDFLRHEIK